MADKVNMNNYCFIQTQTLHIGTRLSLHATAHAKITLEGKDLWY
jgi:hypothetical protein